MSSSVRYWSFCMRVNNTLTKKIIHILLTGVTCLLFIAPVSAQDSDSAAVKPVHTKVHSAKKAMLYSAVCPGLGQIYNKKYWKLPIIYVGLGTAAYFFVSNLNYYHNYNNALKQRDNYTNGIGQPDQYYNLYSSAELSDIVSYYRKNVDICVIVAAGIYIMQLVDANVDAQLHGFNVSDDLSLNFTPHLTPNFLNGSVGFQPGFTLVKRF